MQTRVIPIDKIVEANKAAGLYFFEPDTMRFFSSRIQKGYSGDGGVFFTTSEKPPYAPRAYSVRRLRANGSIKTVGEFCGYDTLAEAREVAKDLAGGQQ